MLIITPNSLPQKTIFADPFYYYKLYPPSKDYILSCHSGFPHVATVGKESPLALIHELRGWRFRCWSFAVLMSRCRWDEGPLGRGAWAECMDHTSFVVVGTCTPLVPWVASPSSGEVAFAYLVEIDDEHAVGYAVGSLRVREEVVGVILRLAEVVFECYGSIPS
jgi:hypothetical protein